MALDRKKILSGGNATLAVLAVLGILVILNAVSARRFKRWDWSGSQIYSLSDKTAKLLSGLKTDVAATVLLQPDDPVYDEIHELLANYQAKSPHVRVEYLDPTRQPARVEEIIKTFGLGRGDRTAIVFSSGERHRHITLDELVDLDMSTAEMGMAPRVKDFKGEAAFTSAILSVSEENQKTVYFLKGHGEIAIEDGGPGGISRLAEALKRQNLKVVTTDALGKGGIPKDCDLLVLAGPTLGFAPSEADALGAYIDGGGRLLALVDPVLSREGGMQELGIERTLLARGVAVGNDIVLDPSRLLTFGSAESFGVSDFPSHIITKDLAGTFIVMSLARSVAPVSPPQNGWVVTSLLRTSEAGWAERDLKDLGGAVSKGPDDGPGPVSVGVAAEKKAAAGGKDARLIVIGNSRVAHNQFIGAGSGLDFLLNAAGFLVGQEEQIGIAPKEPEQVRLQMSPNQERAVALFTLFGMPGLAILAGVVVWLFRRR